MSEYIKVELSKLRAFSGVLYDENGKEIMFNGNPFYVPDDYLIGNDEDCQSLRQLHTSISQDGLLSPLLVRPAKEGDGYEILSGYGRKRVCEELAKTNPEFAEVPVIIIECDDDTASSIITSANVQRRTDHST